MGESEGLLRALKQVMKQRGMRYADLATRLGVSEVTVKRMLGRGRMDLARLEQVCMALDVGFFELARIARGAREVRDHLEAAQEHALAADARLLTMFHLLCNDWDVPQIRAEFSLSEVQSVRLLAALDRLKLIELLPGNRARVLVPRGFAWRSDGPVLARYRHAAMGEFLSDAFEGGGAMLRMEIKELSDESIAVLGRRLEQLRSEFNDCAEVDASLPADRRRSVGVLLALRPWVFSLLESLRAEHALAHRPRPPRSPVGTRR